MCARVGPLSVASHRLGAADCDALPDDLCGARPLRAHPAVGARPPLPALPPRPAAPPRQARQSPSPITNHPHQSPVTNHQSPITSHQSPITNHQSPITNHQSPITNHQSPSPIVRLRLLGRLILDVPVTSKYANL
eukprot:7390506-Prymnesium_polylepis.1